MSHVIHLLTGQLGAIAVIAAVAGFALGASLALLRRTKRLRRDLDALTKETAEFALAVGKYVLKEAMKGTDA